MNPDDSILTRIVIRRNQSLDWSGLLRFVAWGSIPSLVFVVFAVYAGWWPIVGFCAGTLVLAAAMLYEVMMSARDREVVTITNRCVVVEAGRHRPQMRIELDRYWTRVKHRDGPPPALALTSGRACVTVAAALSGPERKKLAHRLAALVGPRSDMRNMMSTSLRDTVNMESNKS